jgi:hypothetical protein
MEQILSGIELHRSVDPNEMMKLIIKRTAEKRAINSGRIQIILERDPNKKLYEMVNSYIEATNGARLSVEDLISYLELSVHDADGQVVTPIGICTNPDDPTTEVVSEETYNNLRELSVDPKVAEAEAKAELDTRKIY